MSIFMDELMAEIINYGGVAVPRSFAYKHALRVTGSEKCADWFAFGGIVCNAKQLTPGEAARLIPLDVAVAAGVFND